MINMLFSYWGRIKLPLSGLVLFAADLWADWPLVLAGVATAHLATVVVLVAVNQTTYFLLTSMQPDSMFHY